MSAAPARRFLVAFAAAVVCGGRLATPADGATTGCSILTTGTAVDQLGPGHSAVDASTHCLTDGATAAFSDYVDRQSLAGGDADVCGWTQALIGAVDFQPDYYDPADPS